MHANQHEIRVFGLQRSGIHAVVNWIIQQSGGPTLFINDIKRLDASPYCAADDFNWYDPHDSACKFDVARERAGEHIPKRHLILGYEDTDLTEIPAEFDRIIKEGVGPSERRTNILIVRDPFNLFASRFAFFNSSESCSATRSCWHSLNRCLG